MTPNKWDRQHPWGSSAGCLPHSCCLFEASLGHPWQVLSGADLRSDPEWLPPLRVVTDCKGRCSGQGSPQPLPYSCPHITWDQQLVHTQAPSSPCQNGAPLQPPSYQRVPEGRDKRRVLAPAGAAAAAPRRAPLSQLSGCWSAGWVMLHSLCSPVLSLRG